MTRSPTCSAPNNPIAPKELKELKRVYDQLCYFAEKAQAMERISVIRDTLAEYHRPLTNSMRQRDFFLSTSSRRQSVSEQDQQRKMMELQTEQTELEKKLSDIRGRPIQHIRPQDTAAALKSLGKRVTKREVQNMMWEVDEKLDGVIDWDEFHLNFERNIRDSSGLEPANFYHMVQFMIYDHDNNGMVSIDETMNMLYARVGREQMETTITKLFGGDDGAPIKEVGHQGGEIDFERYWEVVVREQQRRHDAELAEKKQRKKRTSR
jgi:Ca2+-binding EF-hand superfamily protein